MSSNLRKTLELDGCASRTVRPLEAILHALWQLHVYTCTRPTLYGQDRDSQARTVAQGCMQPTVNSGSI